MTESKNGGFLPQKPMVQTPIKRLLANKSVAQRMEEVLGKRAPQFASSIISLTNQSKALAECEPNSVLASAMTAATLDLPINKDLGFAWIVPYKGQAQFQLGWKGFVQLALRSGQYAGMNACTVCRDAFGGYDDIGEPIILWDRLDRTAEAYGYAFTFKLVNGFKKTEFWTRDEVEAHARRFSQAYSSGRDTPWKSDFDAMALKTVVKQTLGRWGILSIDMQTAIKADQGVVINVDSDEVVYPDNNHTVGTERPPRLPDASDASSEVNEATSSASTDASDASGEPEPHNVGDVWKKGSKWMLATEDGIVAYKTKGEAEKAFAGMTEPACGADIPEDDDGVDESDQLPFDDDPFYTDDSGGTVGDAINEMNEEDPFGSV